MVDCHNLFGHCDNCVSINDDELADAPRKTNDTSNPESNNGLITSIWGPPTWESFHSITFGYPIDPTDEQKIDYLNYFILLGKVLPCIYCRMSYQDFIKKKPTLLNSDTVQSRRSLIEWGHALHDAVNNKLGVDYGVTYNELCYKYESYRAKCTNLTKGCMMPLDIKAKSFQKADIHRATIVDIRYCKAMCSRAHDMGLVKYSDFLHHYQKVKRNSKEWMIRDCAARKIIKYMRKNGISALDPDGLPGCHELMLLSLMCSTLDNEKLENIYVKINNNPSA